MTIRNELEHHLAQALGEVEHECLGFGWGACERHGEDDRPEHDLKDFVLGRGIHEARRHDVLEEDATNVTASLRCLGDASRIQFRGEPDASPAG
jgi:hypothetical protein